MFKFIAQIEDKKLTHKLIGLGDGCTSCVVLPCLWNNQDQILQGFEVKRTVTLHQEAVKMLPKDSQGKIIRTKGRATTLGEWESVTNPS